MFPVLKRRIVFVHILSPFFVTMRLVSKAALIPITLPKSTSTSLEIGIHL